MWPPGLARARPGSSRPASPTSSRPSACLPPACSPSPSPTRPRASCARGSYPSSGRHRQTSPISPHVSPYLPHISPISPHKARIPRRAGAGRLDHDGHLPLSLPRDATGGHRTPPRGPVRLRISPHISPYLPVSPRGPVRLRRRDAPSSRERSPAGRSTAAPTAPPPPHRADLGSISGGSRVDLGLISAAPPGGFTAVTWLPRRVPAELLPTSPHISPYLPISPHICPAELRPPSCLPLTAVRPPPAATAAATGGASQCTTSSRRSSSSRRLSPRYSGPRPSRARSMRTPRSDSPPCCRRVPARPRVTAPAARACVPAG